MVVDNRTIAAVSEEAYVHSREFVHIKMFTPTNHNLLPEVTAVVKPVKADFSDYSTFGSHRVTIL